MAVHSKAAARAIRAALDGHEPYPMPANWQFQDLDSVGAWIRQDRWMDVSRGGNAAMRRVYQEVQNYPQILAAVRRLKDGGATEEDLGWIRATSLGVRQGLVELGWLASA